MNPIAYLVVAADGFRAVFLARSVADCYAANCRGTIYPLYMESA